MILIKAYALWCVHIVELFGLSSSVQRRHSAVVVDSAVIESSEEMLDLGHNSVRGLV